LSTVIISSQPLSSKHGPILLLGVLDARNPQADARVRILRAA
jgi:hypothetical protein